MRQFFLILGILVLAAVLTYLVRKLYIRLAVNSVLNGDRKAPGLLYRLLKIPYGGKYLFPDISLLGGAAGNPNGYYFSCELLFINSAGVFVLRSVPGSGYVECSQENIWRRMINPMNGTKQTSGTSVEYLGDDAQIKDGKKYSSIVRLTFAEAPEGFDFTKYGLSITEYGINDKETDIIYISAKNFAT